jgi:transposase
MRKPYPSDISREEYEIIKDILEGCRKVTKPRKCELYDAFRAVLYLLKEGCAWRAIPRDFPEWHSVYSYFCIWKEPDEAGKTAIDRALEELVSLERLSQDKEPRPAMIVVDSKSVRNTEMAEEKGYDAGKKLQA